MQYLLWRVTSVLLRRTPLSAGYAFAALCGRVAFFCSPRLRRTTLRNYRRVLLGAPADAIRHAARCSIQNYCCYLVDFSRLRAARDAECLPGEVFDRLRCITARRGVVIVAMHFGNWDAGAAAAVREGLDVTVVADTFGDPRLDREVFGARERLGLKLVSAERLTPSALRCLKRGGLLALLLDKPSPGSGVSVPFFGSCVEVPAGPARIALKSGAAIVPVAFPRTTAGKPLVSALADFNIDATPTGDFETDVHRITAEVMAVHERFIREYPEQWYMFREMWPRPTAGGAP